MAFGYTGGATSGGSASSASITHGLTINEGDLVVAYINSNDSNAISNDAGGAAWTNPINETPATETARHALFWKLAGASEPASYTWTLGGSGFYQVIVKVFTAAATPVVDAGAVSARTTTSTNTLICTAIDTQVISDNALSVVFGGKDNRSGASAFTTADNSFTGVVGDAGNQTAAGAHRVYTTGETFSGNVIVSGATGPTDATYSVHMSFLEGGRSITNIDGDDDVQAGQTSVTITTTDLDAAPTVQTATLGGEALTINSWASTSVSVDIPLHLNLRWGSTTNQLALTDDTGTVTLDNVTFSSPTGWSTVVLGSIPDTATTASYYEEAIADIPYTMLVGDILAWEDATGLTVDSQTLPTIDPPATTTGDYKIWDETLDTWSIVGTYAWTDGGVPSGGGSTFKEFLEGLAGPTHTQALIDYLSTQGFTGSVTNSFYEFLKTKSSKNSHSERFKEWESNGFT